MAQIGFIEWHWIYITPWVAFVVNFEPFIWKEELVWQIQHKSQEKLPSMKLQVNLQFSEKELHHTCFLVNFGKYMVHSEVLLYKSLYEINCWYIGLKCKNTIIYISFLWLLKRIMTSVNQSCRTLGLNKS